MNISPNDWVWVGIVGGIIGIVSSVVNFVILWRNRRRLEIRIISAHVYRELWKSYDIEKVGIVANVIKDIIKEGACRRAFIVLEFAITNEFPTDITVGRFIIDNWIFSDHHTKELMYPLKRDYRVFDLYSRAPISLEKYVKIPAKGSFGYRIEIFEETDGPERISLHARYVLDLPQSYMVKFQTNLGKRKFKIKPLSVHEIDSSYAVVHRWSDLLDSRADVQFGAPLPQGVEYPVPSYRLKKRIQNWYKRLFNKIWYGTLYRLPGQQNRFVVLVNKTRGGRKNRPTSHL
jgi:hypothetical protein